MRWASGSVSCAIPAPPKDVSPSLVSPVIRYRVTLSSPAMLSVSPTSRFPRSAVCVSSDASVAFFGGEPST